MTIKKLYSSSFAPNPLRVNYMLKLKGIDIDFVDIDILKQEQLTAEFKAINPDCTIPVALLDDGTMLSDTIGILHYIEKSHPDTPLMGSSIIEQAQILSMMHRIYTQGSLSIASIVRNGAVPGFEDRALPGPNPIKQIPELIERGTIMLNGFYQSINKSLGNCEYLVGDTLSQADVDLYVSCNFANFVKQTFDPAALTHLAAHHQRMHKIINN